MITVPKFLVDLAERVFWTAAQAGLGLLSVDSLHVGTAWAVPVAAGLAVVKGVVAKHVGNPDSASTVPSVGAASPGPGE